MTPRLLPPGRVLGLMAVLGIAAPGCADLLGLGGPEVSIGFAVDASVQRDLHLYVGVGGHWYRLDEPGRIMEHAPRSGELRVTVQLLESDRIVGTDAFRQEFGDGYEHWVHARVGGARPTGYCIGAVSAVPVEAPVSDTMFVVHGRIPKDAIC